VTGNPRIRPATPDDFELLLEIREEVAIDLLQRGIPSNPNSLTRQHLEDWTSDGVLWVADLDGEAIGSIAVWFHDPTEYWPRADLASYVRDLMVDPRLRHQGYGAMLLGWAESYSSGRGRNRVRLDCDAVNERLCRYYKEAGYRHVITDEYGFALYEKALI
jgi:GNAT superfamily N-acetyltransferase